MCGADNIHMEPTVKVRIMGPNLNFQQKGQFHVHAAECGDCQRYGPSRYYGGDADGEQEPVVEVTSMDDVSAYIYADHLSDYGLTLDDEDGQELIGAWLSDFWFAPCLDGQFR